MMYYFMILCVVVAFSCLAVGLVTHKSNLVWLGMLLWGVVRVHSTYRLWFR